MKITLARIAFIVVLFLSFSAPKAQTLDVGCVDGAIRQQALDMKKTWVAQGFTPIQDKMIGLESKKFKDLTVELKKGVFYQIIFIGNALAQSITLEMYDDTGLKMSEKTVKRENNDQNYISMSFTPEYSGYYVMSLTQVLSKKMKISCSAFMLMELKK